MFRRVRALIAHGHQVANDAQFTLQLAQALIADIEDGVEVRLQLDDNAAKKAAALMLGKGGDFPVAITFDPEWDKRPSPVSKFVGGPHDGKHYRISPDDIADGEIVLRGGHRYKWDGHVFRFVRTSEK